MRGGIRGEIRLVVSRSRALGACNNCNRKLEPTSALRPVHNREEVEPSGTEAPFRAKTGRILCCKSAYQDT